MNKIIHYTTKNEEGKFAVIKYYPSNEEVKKIMGVLTSKNRPVQIEWRGNLLKTSNIEIFDKDEKNQPGFQKTAYTDEEIKEFEQMLKNLEKKPLKHPLSYYGEDKEVIPAQEFGKYRFPESRMSGRIRNDIVGLSHASLTEYLLEIRAISRRWVRDDSPAYGWAIGDIRAYEDYCAKKRSLDDLKSRRAHAEKMEKESMNALIGSKEVISKLMEMPR